MFKHTSMPLLALLIWAFNINVNKLAVGVIEPAAITFYREFIAGVLLALVFGRGMWRVRQQIRAQAGRLFVLGVLGTLVFQCLAYVAALTTSATNMGLITAMVPLLTIGFGVALLGETATMGGVLGGLISLFGLGYLLTEGNPASLLSRGITLGDGLMVVAAACYALYNVLLKRWQLGLSTWHSLTAQIAAVLPLLLFYYLEQGAPAVTAKGLPLVLYAGVGASLIAPFLWIRGVELLGASRASTLINLLPVFSVGMAIALLGEHPYTYHLIGGGIALLGVGLANAWKRPLHRSNTAAPHYPR